MTHLFFMQNTNELLFARYLIFLTLLYGLFHTDIVFSKHNTQKP